VIAVLQSRSTVVGATSWRRSDSGPSQTLTWAFSCGRGSRLRPRFACSQISTPPESPQGSASGGVIYVPALARLLGWLTETLLAASARSCEFWAALLFNGLLLSPMRSPPGSCCGMGVNRLMAQRAALAGR
jgi:hypothetical protein